MPLPTGLVDIRLHRASAEDDRRRSEAATRREFGRIAEFQDALIFEFEGGHQIRLPVNKAALRGFLMELRGLHDDGVSTRYRRDIQQDLGEAIAAVPVRAPRTLYELYEQEGNTPARPAPTTPATIPLTAWARLLES